MRRALTMAVAAALAVGLSGAAQSATYIALQQDGVNGGALTQVASGADSAAWAGQYGPVFNFQNISVTSLGGLLDSVALNVLGTAAADLSVFVTVTDAAQAPLGFLSGLTSNVLPAGWTVDLSTWMDAANGLYATTTQLGTATFASIGTDVDLSALAGLGAYSVTGLFSIHSTGHSLDAALSTIHVEAVPEPTSLMLLVGGLVLLGMFLSGRRAETA